MVEDERRMAKDKKLNGTVIATYQHSARCRFKASGRLEGAL